MVKTIFAFVPQPPLTQTLVQSTARFHCPVLSQLCELSGVGHRAEPGVQTPPQELPTHAFGQFVGAPYCPLALHVRI